MFTGLVEATGRVVAFEREGVGARLAVEVPFGETLQAGESVAVDGCCLTALPGGAGRLVADLSPETLARTTLGSFRPDRRVNLERALRLDARLGGHLVLGHVDGVSRVTSVTDEGDAGRRVGFALAEDERPFIVPKGSVAVDGVSLTVACLRPDGFEVALVPHTLSVTALSDLEVGREVNVEHDLLGKHVLRALALAGQVELTPGARERLGLA